MLNRYDRLAAKRNSLFLPFPAALDVSIRRRPLYMTNDYHLAGGRLAVQFETELFADRGGSIGTSKCAGQWLILSFSPEATEVRKKIPAKVPIKSAECFSMLRSFLRGRLGLPLQVQPNDQKFG